MRFGALDFIGQLITCRRLLLQLFGKKHCVFLLLFVKLFGYLVYFLVDLSEAVKWLRPCPISLYEAVVHVFLNPVFWRQKLLGGQLREVGLELVGVFFQVWGLELEAPINILLTINLGLHQLLQGNVPLFEILSDFHFTSRLIQLELTIILDLFGFQLSLKFFIFWAESVVTVFLEFLNLFLRLFLCLFLRFLRDLKIKAFIFVKTDKTIIFFELLGFNFVVCFATFSFNISLRFGLVRVINCILIQLNKLKRIFFVFGRVLISYVYCSRFVIFHSFKKLIKISEE